jgi:uncharacterized protein YjiS (DUF1127 family)
MVLTLKKDELLRLRRAAGSSLEVLCGHAWVTEAGGAGDRLLGPGATYRVSGDGLVLVGGEIGSREPREIELAVEPPAAPGFVLRLARRLISSARARRAATELSALSDHMLRDIGLRREQIALASRSLEQR